MSYSCTSRADAVLKVISDAIYEKNGSQNTWTKDGNEYFYEVGRENSDGSITGRVWLLKGQLAYPKGSFKIDSDGALIRFPHLSKDIRKIAKKESYTQQRFAAGDMFVVS